MNGYKRCFTKNNLETGAVGETRKIDTVSKVKLHRPAAMKNEIVLKFKKLTFYAES